MAWISESVSVLVVLLTPQWLCELLKFVYNPMIRFSSVICDYSEEHFVLKYDEKNIINLSYGIWLYKKGDI